MLKGAARGAAKGMILKEPALMREHVVVARGRIPAPLGWDSEWTQTVQMGGARRRGALLHAPKKERNIIREQ